MRINMGYVSNGTNTGGNIGGALTQPLILVGDPTQPLEAATKQYVDSVFTGLDASAITGSGLSVNVFPAFIGDINKPAGSGAINLNNTGVTPGVHTKVTVDASGRITGSSLLNPIELPPINWSSVIGAPTTLSGYGITDALSILGGTVTGFISLTGPITNPLQAVTKDYVDTALGGSGTSVPTGTVIRKGTSSAATGFLRCNGAFVSQTTYANLYTVIGDTYGTSVIGLGSGKPWKRQYDINTTNTATDIVGWESGTNLPEPVVHSQAIITSSRVYLLGGFNGTSYVSTVYTASINADGTLGTWATGTSLPGPLANSQAIVTSSRVYLLGGYNNSVYLSTVYTASINADGTLGTWTTGTSLPGPLGSSQAVLTSSRVYLLGGHNGTAYVSTVYTAPINADGTLGTWTTGASLPGPLGLSQAIVTSSRVYLLGGHNGTAYVSTVYTALINADGTLGAWTTGTPLPGPLSWSQAVVTTNRVYLLGGYIPNSYVSTVYTAPINADGTLGTWTTGTSLPGPLAWSQAVVTTNRVHLMGGWNGTNYTSIVYNAPINADGTLGTWTAGTSLPKELEHSQAIVTSNRVYLLGGLNGTYQVSTVYTAPINADGTLGTWSTGTPLPGPLSRSQAVITTNRVYLLGGTSGATFISTVYTASINADGTLGSWSTGTPLPGPLAWSQAVVTTNRVYLLGGHNGTSTVSTVYTAPINADGTLGSWTTGTSLPGPLADSQAIVTSSRVYLLGSSSSFAVYTAPINADGTLGTWDTGTPLPVRLGVSQAIVTSNRVYLLGGWTGSAYTSTVYTAPINADGTLGAWTTGTPLPSTLGHSQAIVTSSRVYLLGGQNSSVVSSTVYSAPFTGGLNSYTSGTTTPAGQFTLPDTTLIDSTEDGFRFIKT